ncbi:MAG: hypothetical protein COV76_03635 [Candidatus Omnitrophica bacterium CG11_big_fil_rev_8_21_14_0_20_64_10]|nr:MAG: hypothetical protein COV76_03635 [Candidatus Omnitrophica bacterium CG11_big_fil_rev_8_21_14_0_20_64_10]
MAAGCGVPQQPPRDVHLEDVGPDRLPYAQFSNYPDAMQAGYVLFTQRCSKCHTPARPLNSRIASRELWSRYVTQMQRRAGSGITLEEARKIIDFLVYDSKVRKLDRPDEWRAHREALLEKLKREHPDIYELEYAGQEETLLTVR